MTRAVKSYLAGASFRLEPGTGAVTVVLLHGLGGDCTQPWEYASGRIGREFATRLAPDARAHGSSLLQDLSALSFDVMVDDLIALVDHLRVGPRLVLVGVSMGATTALRFALREERRVGALVLIRPVWTNEPLPTNLAAFGEIASSLRSHGPVAGRAIFSRSSTYKTIARASASAAASVLDQFQKPNALERVRRLEDMPRSVPYAARAELSAITAPTLVIEAPDDPIHPLSIADEWARFIPTARLSRICSRDGAPDRHRAALRYAVDNFIAHI